MWNQLPCGMSEADAQDAGAAWTVTPMKDVLTFAEAAFT